MAIEAEENRRDFLILTTSAFGVAGVAAAAWPFIRSWSPSADVLAQATTEVDISTLQKGQMITIPWQGKPVFVIHRTPEMITSAQNGDKETLPDPAKDADRVKKPEFLVLPETVDFLQRAPPSTGLRTCFEETPPEEGGYSARTGFSASPRPQDRSPRVTARLFGPCIEGQLGVIAAATLR